MTAPFYRFGKQGFVAKSAQNILTRIRRDSPCGCPISAKPIQSFSRPVRTGASPVLATRIESAWCGDKKPLPIPKVSNGTAVKNKNGGKKQ